MYIGFTITAYCYANHRHNNNVNHSENNHSVARQCVCTGRATRAPGRARKLNNLNGPGQAASKIIPEICIVRNPATDRVEI